MGWKFNDEPPPGKEPDAHVDPASHAASPQLTPAAWEMDPGPRRGPPSFQLGLKILLYPFPLSTMQVQTWPITPRGTTSIRCVSSVCVQRGKEKGLKP